MGRLVAGIAHEINNPVNAVINTLGPLEEALKTMVAGAEPEAAARAADEAEEMLRVVQRGAARTKAIVQALHNYSRGDEQRPRELSVARSVDDTLDLLRHRLRNVRVEKQIDPDLRITGFPGQIDQVFMNLITNAAQAVGARDQRRHDPGGGGRARPTTWRSPSPTTAPGSPPTSSRASSIRSSPPRTWARARGSVCRSSTGSSTATAAASRSRARSVQGTTFRITLPSRQPAAPPTAQISNGRRDKLAARPGALAARCQVDMRLAAGGHFVVTSTSSEFK